MRTLSLIACACISSCTYSHALAPPVLRPAKATIGRKFAGGSKSVDHSRPCDGIDYLKAPVPRAAVAIFSALLTLQISITTAAAVSGGGFDYAGLDISGQNFSNGNYRGKDFTQVIAKATNFGGSNLAGCRFYKAYLVRADFSNTDLRGASLEDTSMDEASLRNANAAGAYFSSSILDAKDLENVDFTDAQFPLKTLPLLCEREDLKGTNPVTGADTRETLMCP